MSELDGLSVSFRYLPEESDSEEQWLPVVGAPAYEISDQGRVYSLGRTINDTLGRTYWHEGRILTPVLNDGHHMVKIHDKTRYVHHLVLEAFEGLCPQGQEALHANDVGVDNRRENLRWGTRSENIFDQVINGRHQSARKTKCKWDHELTGSNLGFSTDGKNRRYCKACKRRRTAEWKKRQCA